jgi:hypothetical protein
MSNITNIEIERFYNKDREHDVPYTFFNKIPRTLVSEIRKILTYQKKYFS